MRFDVDSIVRPVRNAVSNGVKTSRLSRTKNTQRSVFNIWSIFGWRRLRLVASWRAAVILLMVFAAIWYYSGRALSRDYSWTQTSWDATADVDPVTGLAKHNPTPPGFPQSGWTKYFFRDTTNTQLIDGTDGTKDLQLNLVSDNKTYDTASEFTGIIGAGTSGAQVLTEGAIALGNSGNWIQLTDISTNVDVGGALTYDGSNIIYAFRGGGNPTFYSYDISNNSWTQLSNFPQNINEGGSLAYVPARGGAPSYVYGFRGGAHTGFFRYNVTTPRWAVMLDAPFSINDGGALVYDGAQYLYAIKGGLSSGQRFARFNLDTLIWAELTSNSSWNNLRAGGALAKGDANKIYALRGNALNQNHVASYSTAASTWAQLNLPASDLVGWGGALAFSSAENALYALVGDNTNKVRRYDVTGGVWSNATPFPQPIGAGGALVYSASQSALFALRGGITRGFYKYPSYNLTGTFESSEIPLGGTKKLDEVFFDRQIPSGTNITVEVRAGNTPTGGGAGWTSYISVAYNADGTSIDGLNGVDGGKQYIQFKVTLTTTTGLKTPKLDRIQITYSGYPTNGELVSSPYDASNSETFVAGIKWTEDATLPAGTNVQFQIRTALTQAGLASALWQGPIWRTTAADPQSYYENISQPTICPKASGVVTCTIPGGVQINAKNQFFQYRILLTSSGANTPIVKDVSVTYVINTPPAVQITNTPQKDSP